MMKVVIIDKNDQYIRKAYTYFRSQGCTVFICKNSLQAVTMVKSTKPNLILLNIDVGDDTPYNLVNHIKDIVKTFSKHEKSYFVAYKEGICNSIFKKLVSSLNVTILAKVPMAEEDQRILLNEAKRQYMKNNLQKAASV